MSIPLRKSACYDFLSESDKCNYDILQARLADPDHRYNRNHRVDQFQGMLAEIREFCEGPDAWRRYLACGICWCSDFIATNTQQLTFLLRKSKSSINGVFAQMGLGPSPGRDSDVRELQARIPFLKGRAQELRQWTIRRKAEPGLAAEYCSGTLEKSFPDFAPFEVPMGEPFRFDDDFRFEWTGFDSTSCDHSLSDSEFRFQPELRTSFQPPNEEKSRQFAM
jgi:hypothetical protein